MITAAFRPRLALGAALASALFISAAPASAATWSTVATEWQRFSVDGTQTVRFGAGERWITKTVSGRVDCRNTTFGSDPAPNVVKRCDVQTSEDSVSAPDPQETPEPEVPANASLALKPFASNSPWKSAIPSNATYASMGDPRVQAFQNVGGRLSVNVTKFTQWVYQAKSSDPQVSVNVAVRNLPGLGGTSDGANRVGTVTLRMPAGAEPDSGTDRHLTVISEDGRWAHEFWYMYRDGSGGWRAVAYAKVDLTGDGTMISGEGVRDAYGAFHNPDIVNYGWGATRAYGGSSLAGLIRAGEVTTGTIDHALYMSLPHYILAIPANRKPVFPASRHDTAAGVNPSHIVMGTRFAIPRNVNVESLGLSAAGLKLARAMQTYGAYVLDQSAVPVLNSDGVAAQADGRALASQRNDLAKIHSLMTIVD